VPPGDIPQSVLLKLREQAWDAIDFCDCDTTTQKGAKAVQLVVGMIKAGLFPLPGLPHEQQDKAMQIAGDDIIVHLETKDIRIQVKCDFRGGERQYGGTGFLFLQTAEINPLKYH